MDYQEAVERLENERSTLFQRIDELEEENGRLALKIVRMEHEQQERMLTRVLTTVEDQAELESDFDLVQQFLEATSVTYLNGIGLTRVVALNRLISIRMQVLPNV